MTAAPPIAIPAIAPVDSIGEELEGVELAGLVEVEVEVEVGIDVGMTRVGVRTGSLAVRVKYTARSRLSQVAGAVTVAPPTELADISTLDVSTVVVESESIRGWYKKDLTYLPPISEIISSGTT